MTNLKNMSVDALLARVGFGMDIGVFKEMAHRLREQELLAESVCVALRVPPQQNNLPQVIHDLEKRANQAESALLACQAREMELMEAALDALPDVDDWPNSPQRKRLEQILSHSTGSKIMADAKRYQWLKANHLQTGPDSWIRTGDDLEEAIDSALEAKHGET